MNNKKLGSDFETDFCELLASRGYWVHFISPDRRGAQPFDVIAAKNGIAYAFDCKTCKIDSFSIDRMEENQKTAFEWWLKANNTEPCIAVKHNNRVYLIGYGELKKNKSIKLKEAKYFGEIE